ncbi:uncharacterized protein LOC120921909 [Rana temporaria]|uniref:uncharacterized protein LOC120921909 n=1 Tax=Rana temporaria TaxID=8407 RepID=UPI001AAD8510|nr:uncharacterized protein LOC120921909 [Rana temporaria]
MDEESISGDEMEIIKGGPELQTPKSCTEVLDSNQGAADPLLKEEELCEAVPVGTPPHFSTPLTNKGGSASRVVLEYKSFYNVECEKIIHQLRQNWSTSKRKLEELDISTIEAEPPPFYRTPSSVLQASTYRAKRRRRIDGPDLSETTKLKFSFAQCKPNPVCQILEGSVDWLPRLSSDGKSATPKRKLFQLDGKTRHSECNHAFIRRGGRSSAGGDRRTIGWPRTGSTKPRPAQGEADNKPDLESLGGSIQPLEFRSFFFAECEAICNRLKHCSSKRILDVSTIDAEPPPSLSSSFTFLSEQDSSHAKANSYMGLSQLDLGKMNLNGTAKWGSFCLQKNSNSNATGPRKGAVVNTTKDMGNMHGVGSVANITQDIVTGCDEEKIADATQDIVTMYNGVSAADAPQDIVTNRDGMKAPGATQDIVTMCIGVSAADASQDIVTNCDEACVLKATFNMTTTPDKVSGANTTQDIVKEDGNFVADVTQDIEMEHDFSVANATQEIMPMCDEKGSNVPPNIAMCGVDGKGNPAEMGAHVLKTNNVVTVHDDVANPKIVTLCNRDPAPGRTLNTMTTLSLQDFKTKLTKATHESTTRKVSKMHWVVSAEDSTRPKTETCAEVPVSETAQDMETIQDQAPGAEGEQGRVCNVPVAQRRILMAGDTNIPERAHGAINRGNGINNTTFLCIQRKSDQNGVTIGYSGDIAHICKESLPASYTSPLSTMNSTVTISNSCQVHTERSTTTIIDSSQVHSEGSTTTIDSSQVHSEGSTTTIDSSQVHSEGSTTTIDSSQVHSEGSTTTIDSSQVHSEGSTTTIDSSQVHSEGSTTTIDSSQVHSEGSTTTIDSSQVHSEGSTTTIDSSQVHSEGPTATISDSYQVNTEGSTTTISYSSQVHTEGSTTTINDSSQVHCEGPTATISDSGQVQSEGPTTTISYSSQVHTEGSTATINDSSQIQAEGSKTIAMSTPSTFKEQDTTRNVVINMEVCSNITTCNAIATSIAEDAAFITQELESNTTPSNTEVIVANCTLLGGVPQVAQPKNDSRGIREMSLGGGNPMDSICDLDITYIANEESVFHKGSFNFITSTPLLPFMNSNVFIKKSSGKSIQPNPKLFPNKDQREQKQMAIPKLASSRLPTRGNFTQIRGQLSQDFPTPGPIKSSLPKAAKTSLRVPKPATGISTLRYPAVSTTVIRTPQVTRSVTSEKVQVGLNTTNRIPTGLPRRNVGIAQNGAANRIPHPKGLENGPRAGKGPGIKGGFDADRPSFVRPPDQIGTLANRIHTEKIPNVIPGPPSAARGGKASFLPTLQPAGPRTLGSVRPDLTFICNPQLAGSLTTSRIRPCSSALPVRRKMQAAPVLHSTRGPQ